MSAVFRAGEANPASARREIKFALPETDVGRLRSILRTNARPVVHHQRTSLVRSVYFDDEGLSGYVDSVEGSGTRRKIRLRWYDDGDQDGRFFFEIKRRAFELVVKERVAVDSDRALGTLSYRDMVRHLVAALPASLGELIRIQSVPVLLGEYRREYFEGIDRSLRVTIDSELQWFSQHGKLGLGRRFGVSMPRLVILEVKTDPHFDFDVDELLYPLRLAPTRSSKYVVGCQQLGLAADTRGAVI